MTPGQSRPFGILLRHRNDFIASSKLIVNIELQGSVREAGAAHAMALSREKEQCPVFHEGRADGRCFFHVKNLCTPGAMSRPDVRFSTPRALGGKKENVPLGQAYQRKGRGLPSRCSTRAEQDFDSGRNDPV